MARRLLTPAWIALHLLALSCVAGLFWLGLWQWQRGVLLDRVQNYAYGLEWWLFTAFAVFLWVKTAVDSLEDDADAEPAPLEDLAAPPAQPVAAVDDQDDPELAAYNRHLAALHAQSQREQ